MNSILADGDVDAIFTTDCLDPDSDPDVVHWFGLDSDFYSPSSEADGGLVNCESCSAGEGNVATQPPEGVDVCLYAIGDVRRGCNGHFAVSEHARFMWLLMEPFSAPEFSPKEFDQKASVLFSLFLSNLSKFYQRRSHAR